MGGEGLHQTHGPGALLLSVVGAITAGDCRVGFRFLPVSYRPRVGAMPSPPPFSSSLGIARVAGHRIVKSVDCGGTANDRVAALAHWRRPGAIKSSLSSGLVA